jgi:hypothetical protein
MTYKPGSGSSDPDRPPGGGLRGPDKQQDERRVQRSNDGHGDPVLPASVSTNNIPGHQHTTLSEAAQSGADVRARTDVDDEGAPEGLRRERTHPLNPSTGRSTSAAGRQPAKDSVRSS